MKYTFEDLTINKLEYRSNFEKLLKSVETSSHDHYSNEEKRLDKLDCKIRKSLGIFIPNPCPALSSIYCNDCTGYYKKTVKYNSKGWKTTKNKICKNSKNAVRCPLKDISISLPSFK